jgi:hypothetical protein
MLNAIPYLGVIEGFFGRTWTFQERLDYAEFLRANDYHFFIYAPKADKYLRKSWQQEWPDDTASQLQNLIHYYQQAGLDFGIGLSPFEIYKNYDTEARHYLLNKVERLNRLGVDILCLLFDDMRGDLPDLALTQVRICEDVLPHTRAKRLIMCPTYYTFDKVLERLFGKMPQNYFQDLGDNLPAGIDIFWTGPTVCSQEYPESHMREAIEALGRKPFLWDNYPVNDGADISQFLFLKSFENRPASLAELTTGHAVNPMNQPWLSRIPLYSLPRSYAYSADYDPEDVLHEALSQLCGQGLAKQIISDIDILQAHGLDKMKPELRQRLVRQYSRFDNPVDSQYAKEIIAWLNNEYAFDPACLTG